MGAIGAVGSIILSWSNPADISIAAIEVWGSTTNDRALATMLAAVPVSPNTPRQWVHAGLSPSQTWYYWLRPIGRSGNLGVFQPASATAGVTATTDAVESIDERLRCGQASFTSGETSKAVTLSPAEPNTSYFITLGPNTNKTFWWSSKATGGFTINKSSSGETSLVDWIIMR